VRSLWLGEVCSALGEEAFIIENNTGNRANDIGKLGVDWEQEEEITDKLPEEILELPE